MPIHLEQRGLTTVIAMVFIVCMVLMWAAIVQQIWEILTCC
jgi:hypothetical protein